MGTVFDVRQALNETPNADLFKRNLCGARGKTGKGHSTDYASEQTFGDIRIKIIFNNKKTDLPHPNTL